MQRLGLSEEEKFWLRQPEHFFVPVQIELYKKYGKRLDPTPERLRAWLSESDRAAWKALERAAADAKAIGADSTAKGLILIDRGDRSRAELLAGPG